MFAALLATGRKRAILSKEEISRLIRDRFDTCVSDETQSLGEALERRTQFRIHQS
jgi:hypothetical protein